MTTMLSLLAAGLLAPAIVSAAQAPADNLLLVSFDTSRADHFSAYGAPDDATPAFDSVAAAGALFETAYSHVPETLPAHCTLMTGLLPPTHGVRRNRGHKLPAAAITLAERLSGAGFDTAAFVAAAPLARVFGLDQGFSLYDDDIERGRAKPVPANDPRSAEIPAREVTERALAWLGRRVENRRWFLFVHYYDPHLPYDPLPSAGPSGGSDTPQGAQRPRGLR